MISYQNLKESHLAFHWIDYNQEALHTYKIMPEPLVKELLERKLSDELLNCWISNFLKTSINNKFVQQKVIKKIG